MFYWQPVAVIFSHQISTSQQQVSGIFLSQQINISHQPQQAE